MSVSTSTRLYCLNTFVPADVLKLAKLHGISCKPMVSDRPDWEEDCLRISVSKNIVTMMLSYAPGEHLLFQAFGQEWGCPWIEIRHQDSFFWDYSLYLGGRCVDDFSTVPNYWEAGDVLALALSGRPSLLAAAWGLPEAVFNQYLRNWKVRQDRQGTYVCGLQGKAYSQDNHEYGDGFQCMDFAKKLGFSEKWQYLYKVKFPPLSHDPKRHFLADYSGNL